MGGAPSFRGHTAASALSSRVMRRNTREGGVAERILRQRIWSLGLRFRKYPSGLPGRPDLVFSRAKVCVFVDGDFWHGRNWRLLREQLKRRANGTYWVAKIASNRERDRRQNKELIRLGWLVSRYWETDILQRADSIASEICSLVERRRVDLQARRHEACRL